MKKGIRQIVEISLFIVPLLLFSGCASTSESEAGAPAECAESTAAMTPPPPPVSGGAWVSLPPMPPQ